MRALCVLTVASSFAALALADSPSRAEPDPAVGFLVGSAVLLVGFTVGATVVTTAEDSNATANAGWLVMQSGFALAPWAAHGVLEEWSRGLAFSALPAAAVGGDIGLFEYSPGTILHGTLAQQRVLWALFGAGLVSGVVGVLDVAHASYRTPSIAIMPMLAPGQLGVQMGGDL